MERVVARETPAEQRCPYCHDALAGADLPADDLVECDGCRTSHHRACIEELGRCSIRGCERSLHVAPPTPLDQPIPAAELRSAVRREVERRLRERARTFVQAHAQAVAQGGGRAAVEVALALARAAMAARDWAAAADAWHEVARRLTLARPEELAELELRHPDGSYRLTARANSFDVEEAAEWAVACAGRFATKARYARDAKVYRVLRLLLVAFVASCVLGLAAVQVPITTAMTITVFITAGVLAYGALFIYEGGQR